MSDDIDPADIRPGDLVRLDHSDTLWRVVEPVEERTTAMHSGDLVGLCVQGSPALGGWKPVRKVDDHIPRRAEPSPPEADAQATLDTGWTG